MTEHTTLPDCGCDECVALRRPFVCLAPAKTDLPECGSTQGKCPTCGAQLESGYGMAGGGMGVYEYCETHGVITKIETD